MSTIGLILYYELLALGIAGLVVLRRRNVPILPFISLALLVTFTAAAAIGVTRYRYPVDLGLVVLAGIALDAGWRWAQAAGEARQGHERHGGCRGTRRSVPPREAGRGGRMSDLAATATLLAAEHPDRECFRNPDYLPWLYEQNPAGPAIQESVDRCGAPVSHFALLPQVWARGDETASFCVGVNGVTRAGSGQAHFLALLRRGIREMGRRGVVAGFGVTNASSTAMTLTRTGIGNVGPLPVVVRPALPVGEG